MHPIPDAIRNDLRNLNIPLGNAADVSDEVMMHRIKDAYRFLALKYHPDRVSQNDPLRNSNGEKFKVVSASYENLLKHYEYTDDKVQIKK